MFPIPQQMLTEFRHQPPGSSLLYFCCVKVSLLMYSNCFQRVQIAHELLTILRTFPSWFKIIRSKISANKQWSVVCEWAVCCQYTAWTSSKSYWSWWKISHWLKIGFGLAPLSGSTHFDWNYRSHGIFSPIFSVSANFLDNKSICLGFDTKKIQNGH